MYYRLFHVTTEAAAAAILAGGFRDPTGFEMTADEAAGLWVADRPLVAGEGSRGTVPLLIGLEADPGEMHRCEWVEDGKPYREWLLPAAVLNARGTVRRATDADERAAGGATYAAAVPSADE